MLKYIGGVVILVVVIGIGVFAYKSMQLPAGISRDYKGITLEIDGKPLTLTDGRYEDSVPGSISKTVTQYFGNEARGDLNGDGQEDIAFLITQTTGGSGGFYYAVVALKTDKGYKGTNAAYIGDRIAPQTTEIQNGRLVVNYADRAPQDPMTAAPSVGVSQYLVVRDGMLAKVPK